jgi:proton glutamate symport protein
VKSRLPLVALFFLLVAIVLTVMAGMSHQPAGAALPDAADATGSLLPTIATTARWLTLLVLGMVVAARRSLTLWIVLSMLIGIELGHDAPSVAMNLKVLSDAFLRLVKTIIAPLVFATLVVGIAGHADLKQVGRMGVKALVYFEVVTTFALFIGLGAINLTKAGVGISKAGVKEETLTAAAPQTAAFSPSSSPSAWLSRPSARAA